MSLDAHRHFHDELSHVKVRLLTMSGEAEAALSLAVEALLERDVEKAQHEVVAIARKLEEEGLITTGAGAGEKYVS